MIYLIIYLFLSAVQFMTEPGLLLRFDESTVTVGQKVRLRETVPASHKGGMSAFAHRVDLVSRYDPGSGQMVRPIVPIGQYLTTKVPFDELPQGGFSSHAMQYRVKQFGRKGTDFTFLATTPGVYEVHSQWLVRDGEPGWVIASPILLTVLPAPTSKKP